jgi:hypothetical protein
MGFFDLDERVLAAIIAAGGTTIGALIQLRIAWRKEQAARARGTPPTKKSRRGPVFAVVLLLLAASVGGFAFAQYLSVEADRDTAALRDQLRVELAQISATAVRLEQAQLSSNRAAAGARRNESDHLSDGIAIATLPPCRVRATTGDSAPTCTEQDAVAITLCAAAPSAATAADARLYARPEGSEKSWAESEAAPGNDLGRARFPYAPFERADKDQAKQICAGFASWDSERAFSARIVVKSPTMPTSRDVPHAAVTPAAERIQ